MEHRTCEWCASDISHRGPSARACSKECSRKVYYYSHREQELAQQKVYRESNQAFWAARWAEYYEANADRLAGRGRKYYAENRERELARAAEYRRLNPGKGDAWRKKNPEKWALRNRENQRRRRSSGGIPVDYSAILAEHGPVCHICSGRIDSMADLHFDHVIPLAAGGPHSYENIRPAHAQCNLRKGARVANL